MMKFFDRTPEQQEVIRKAYQFEAEAIEAMRAGHDAIADENPWFRKVLAMPEGREVWKAIDVAIEMAYGEAE